MYYDEAAVRKLAVLVAAHIKNELRHAGSSERLPPRLLTVKQCAAWLSMSPQAIAHRLRRDPEFRACTVPGLGRTLRFDIHKLEAFLLRNGV